MDIRVSPLLAAEKDLSRERQGPCSKPPHSAQQRGAEEGGLRAPTAPSAESALQAGLGRMRPLRSWEDLLLEQPPELTRSFRLSASKLLSEGVF